LRPQVAFLVLAALAASLVVVAPPLHPVPAVSRTGAKERAAEGYGNLPISFEPNVGQAPRRYDFVARGQGFGMAISATGATLALGMKEAQDFVRLDLLGASRSANPRARESLSGKVNYFIGDDPSKWRNEVPTFGRVSYHDVLPGIDVIYRGTNAGTLGYDFVVAPDANPGDIRVRFSGVNDVVLRGGSLVFTTASGAVTQEAPVLYQRIAGRRVPVDGRFSLAGDEVGFEVGAYDHHHPLVIDPTLVYSTYLGGSGVDYGWGIAVDGTGAAYVAGSTSSTNFPTQAPFQGSDAGSFDAFITKLNAAGSALVYSTYLGGSSSDSAQGIAVDGTGAAYVAGSTSSTNFPTQAPFQGSGAGGSDAFVTKLNAAGSALVYSTYLGGSSSDRAQGIAVDGTGAAYVAGYTSSANFPTQAPFQGSGAGGSDAFVTKLNAAGSALVYSTYLGGSDAEEGFGIAVDGTRAAYVTGETSSTDFPTQAPFQGSKAGPDDAFVTKLNDKGSALIYSTYLGGSGVDEAKGITVDGSGAAYVAGLTTSANFPTQAPFQGSDAGSQDAFITKLNATGSALAYSTYLGGSSDDRAQGIAVDGAGAAYVTGNTWSTNFPTQAPFQGSKAGSDDAFITKLNATGSALAYSTYLGGSSCGSSGCSSNDFGDGIAVDGAGAAYVTGQTSSTNFPTQVPFQGSEAGSFDAFVTKLSDTPTITCGGQTVTIQVTTAGTTTSGTPGVDVINGTAGVDTINGLGGNDIICGLGGNDTLNGGLGGNDTLYGGDGNDFLNGLSGHDKLHGGAGNDTLKGGSEGDNLYGERGNDNLDGGQGSDALYGDVGADTLYGGSEGDSLHGGDGIDIMYGEGPSFPTCACSWNDYLFGDAGNDTLYGNIGNDALLGGAGDDTLNGNAKNDSLHGNGGNDTLNGNDGNDSLDGGANTDACNGGAGLGDTGTLCETSINIP
jgi:Ca2+-binding RTX toxin-like protein